MVIKKTRAKLQFRHIYARCYKSYDQAAFSDDILGIDFDDVFNSDNPEEIWRKLYSAIYAVIDSHCPLRSIRITIGKPSYLTDEILSLMRERDKAYLRARKTKTDTLWQLARTFRARVAKELRVARCNYISRQIFHANGDGKKFWRIINSEFFKSPCRSLTQLYSEKDNCLLEGVLAADEINRFFCTVSVGLSEKFKNRPCFQAELTPEVVCDSIPRLSTRRVGDQITLLDQSKSSGFRNVPTRLLKAALELIVDQFTDLLNLCLDKAVFPQSWKHAMVICIPKTGDSRRLNNLRPISLIPITGKVLEHFLNDTIMHHLESNHLLDNRQMGVP